MTLSLTSARIAGSLAHALREAALTGLRKLNILIEARRGRRAVLSLADYDERMLHDIGLNRSEVVGALEVGYGEDPSILLRRTRTSAAAEPAGYQTAQLVTPARAPIIQGFAQGIA